MDKKIIDFSIIIPVYNTATYLNRCLESVIKQNYDSYEIVIINDGSTDDSEKIIKNFIENSKQVNIKYFKTNNNGLSIARNIGINNSKGNYLIFLDSDDALQEYSLQTFRKKIIKNPDVIINRFASYNEKNKLITECKYTFKNENLIFSNNLLYITKQIWFSAWTFVVNKDFIIKNSLFFQPKLLHEDELWSVQLLLKSNKLICNNYPYYLNTSDREGSIITKMNIHKEFDKLDIISQFIHLIDDKNTLQQNRLLKRRIFLIFYQVYNTIDSYKDDLRYEELRNSFIRLLKNFYHKKSFIILIIYKLRKIKG